MQPSRWGNRWHQQRRLGGIHSVNMATAGACAVLRFSSTNNPPPPALLQCGMVPVGVRFAHGFNPYQTRLGLPCDAASGWTDLSENLA